MVRQSGLLNIKSVIFFITLCFINITLPSFAAEPSQDFTFRGLYKCSLSGISFAKIGIHAEQDSHAYAATIDITSTGILDLFVKHSSHTMVDGSGKAYDYGKTVYETNYKTKNKKRYVKLEYEGGKFKQEKLVPPENPAKRPPLTSLQKDGAVDPLTGLFRLRALTRAAIKSGKPDFSLNFYDGRRLTQINASVTGSRVIRLSGEKVPVVAVKLSRKLLAGFTKSELADHDPKEPPLTVYFSNDESFFPVRLEVPLMFGLLTADLFKTCTSSESCLLGNKD